MQRAVSTRRVVARTQSSAWLVVPMLVSLVLGLWNLSRSDSMWRDESVTWQVAHRSVAQIWHLVHHVDAVHGLYYLLMHTVFATWDGGLSALRIPSVVATVIATGVLAATARRLAGPRVALLAAVTFAVLPITVKYEQEGRSYALVTAFVAVALYAFVRALDDDRRRWWTVNAAALVVAAWLNEFAVLVLAAQALALRGLRVPQVTWRRWGVSALVVVLAIAPLALISRSQSSTQLNWLTRPTVWNWTLFVLESAAVLGVVTAVTRAGSASPTARWVAVSHFVVPSAVLLMVSEIRPLYVDRYVLYGYLGLALVAGLGDDLVLRRLATQRRVLWRRSAPVLAGLVALAVLVPWWADTRSPDSRKDDVLAIARATRHVARPGEPVFFLPNRRREWLLSDPALRRELDDVALLRPPAASATLEGTQVTPEVLRRRLHAVDRVVVLSDDPLRPPFTATDRTEIALLRSEFQVQRRVRRHGGDVVVYVRNGATVTR